MREYLKVKVKSLAAEARIIRKEENKAKASYRYLKNKQGCEEDYRKARATWEGLQHHRKVDVRQEARASQLAYAFIRNKAFKYVEASTQPYVKYSTFTYIKPELNWLSGRIAKMATKYGEKKVEAEDIKKWIMEGVEDGKSDT